MPRVKHVYQCLGILVMLLLASYASAPAVSAAPFWEEGRKTPLATQPERPAFVELAKALDPAVVNISSSSKPEVQRPRQRSPFGEEGDPFQDFFDRFFGGRRAPKRQRPSLGSGF